MSRTTAHAYLEAVSGLTLEAAAKDMYLNLCKAEVIADLQPWGTMHLADHVELGYNEVTATIDSVALTANAQTEYAFPSTTYTPIDLTTVEVRRAITDAYITARPVRPFAFGDEVAGGYTEDEPVYFVRGGKIVVYPQFAGVVTEAIRVRFMQDNLDLSESKADTGLSPSAERLWAYKAAVAYNRAINDLPRMQLMDMGYRDYLWALKKQAPIASKR